MSTYELFHSHFSFCRSSSSAEICESKDQPANFSLLSFLATAQALSIEFLPISWDVARGLIGVGGTSRIQEGVVNIDTSFAFKTYRNERRTEHQLFRILINEITILSLPFVRQHPNVAQLQGVCWDIDHVDDRPWPVLVFEKSRLGDMCQFLTHEGKNLDFTHRLELCRDIGKAIYNMHTNHVIHGDLKPDNVLVFEDESGAVSAKVIDFGYSTRFLSHDHRLHLPRSEPWNAPENTGRPRDWTFIEAAKTDLFSFGMLCLWILFEPTLSTMKITTSDQADRVNRFLRHAYDVLSQTKKTLPSLAQQLLSSEVVKGIPENKLTRFFELSLDQNPNIRSPSIFALLENEDLPHELGGKSHGYDNFTQIYEMERDRACDFKIELSISDLYRSDFRLRSHIAQCLISSASQSPSLGLQAAFCYHIGFGVERNQEEVRRILSKLNRNDHSFEIPATTESPNTLQTETVARMASMGEMRWSDFTDIYLSQNKLCQAEERLVKEMQALELVYGSDHQLTTQSKAMLARVYHARGRWNEAQSLEGQVVENDKTRFGRDSPQTLASMNSLASTLGEQGRWVDAERLMAQVIETCEHRLGLEHDFTLTSKTNMALLLTDQGNWAGAKKLQMELLQTLRLSKGADHPATVVGLVNLSYTYRSQGQWDRARELQTEAVKICQTTLGMDHPYTLAAMSQQATTFRQEGFLSEAEELETSVMEIRKEKLGVDHPAYLMSLTSLGLTYYEQGRWKEAEKLQFQVYNTRKQEHTEDDPDMLVDISNLAATLRRLGKWEAAEELLQGMVKRAEKLLGANHPYTLAATANLASALSEQGQWNDAEVLQLQVLKSREATLGAEHPDILTTMANLAATYLSQDRFAEAESLYEKVLEKSHSRLGPEHPKSVIIMANLASTYLRTGRLDDARKLNESVAQIGLAKLGCHHPIVLTTVKHLVSGYTEEEEWHKAEELTRKLLEAQKKDLGSDDPQTRVSMGSLALILYSSGQFEELLQVQMQLASFGLSPS